MKLKYICENCDRTEIYDNPQVAFDLGWDYPPKMYEFKMISPRTCPNCSIDTTIWWALMLENKTLSELSDKQKVCLKRILNEPESIIVEEN